MRKDPEWAICDKCQNYFLPKIGAKLEIEIDNSLFITKSEDFKKV